VSSICPARRAGERGFSLVELSLAMLLLVLAFVIADGLLVESLRSLVIGTRELREPADRLALRQLRDDLRAARPISGWGSGESDPLDCVRPDRIARWQLVGERLERRQLDLDGTDRGARIVLEDVVSFRWQALGSATRVELVRRKRQGVGALGAGSPRWASVAETLESAELLATSRLSGAAP
jgi:prepilin-type N-terminal cleavage/methylation domain-containing protein